MARRRRPSVIQHLVRDLLAVAGLVLMWRGVWVLLDMFDVVVGSQLWTAIGGIVAGLILLHRIGEEP
jgi:hypothetical protein